MTDDTRGGADENRTGDDAEDVRPDGDDEENAVPSAVFEELFATIENRKRELPDDSYTASLFTHEKGIDAVLEKLGEESTELTLAAKEGDREAIRHESADLVYHLLVVLAARDLTLEDLRAELHDRFG